MISPFPVVRMQKTSLGKIQHNQQWADDHYAAKKSISLAPGEHITHAFIVNPEQFEKIKTSNDFYFELRLEYKENKEQKISYYYDLIAHFDSGMLFIDDVQMS